MKEKDVEEQLRREINKFNREYIETCQKRIKVAKSIEIKKLKKIKIDDRKSPAN